MLFILTVLVGLITLFIAALYGFSQRFEIVFSPVSRYPIFLCIREETTIMDSEPRASYLKRSSHHEF